MALGPCGCGCGVGLLVWGVLSKLKITALINPSTHLSFFTPQHPPISFPSPLSNFISQFSSPFPFPLSLYIPSFFILFLVEVSALDLPPYLLLFCWFSEKKFLIFSGSHILLLFVSV